MLKSRFKHWLALGSGSALLGLLLVFLTGCGDAAKKPEAAASSAKIEAKPADMSWTNGMVWIAGGAFHMGAEGGQADEKPVHGVKVDGFWIDQTEVTNEQFEKFVNATHYITTAEKKPDPQQFPGADPALLVPGSIVFHAPGREVSLDNYYQWWVYVPGANWRHPEGPESSIQGKEKHPVVQVSHDDAVAYCKWAGKRLPTEAEWEFAARGGLDGKIFTWGDEQTPGGKWQANIWQGKFPNENTQEDGFRTTAPVASFKPNGYGLYDMSGNVWEWCADWYAPNYYVKSDGATNPQGPPMSESNDPNEPGVPKRVQRGGSFLCSDLYCIGYRPSARMKNTPDSATSHAGFRAIRTK